MSEWVNELVWRAQARQEEIANLTKHLPDITNALKWQLEQDAAMLNKELYDNAKVLVVESAPIESGNFLVKHTRKNFVVTLQVMPNKRLLVCAFPNRYQDEVKILAGESEWAFYRRHNEEISVEKVSQGILEPVVESDFNLID